MYVRPPHLCEHCGVEMHRLTRRARFCFDCTKPYKPNKEASKAHRAVYRAVRRGELPPASTLVCVDCGKPASGYDHRDYSKPLDVQPVCPSCNKLRGPAIGSHAYKAA